MKVRYSYPGERLIVEKENFPIQSLCLTPSATLRLLPRRRSFCSMNARSAHSYLDLSFLPPSNRYEYCIRSSYIIIRRHQHSSCLELPTHRYARLGEVEVAVFSLLPQSLPLVTELNRSEVAGAVTKKNRNLAVRTLLTSLLRSMTKRKPWLSSSSKAKRRKQQRLLRRPYPMRLPRPLPLLPPLQQRNHNLLLQPFDRLATHVAKAFDKD